MAIEVSVEAQLVRVAGTTDLPSGAVVDYAFYNEDTGEEGPSGEDRVRDGAFTFEHALDELRSGDWLVEAWFSPGEDARQPRHVRDLFGAEGEYLAGPQVTVDSPGDPKQLVARTSISVP